MESRHVDEIPQRDLFEEPPPPPKPRVPIVKPNEMMLEDDELTFESGIRLFDALRRRNKFVTIIS